MDRWEVEILLFIESLVKWLAAILSLCVLQKVGGDSLMWTGGLLFFVGNVLWEMRKIRKGEREEK